MTSMTEKDPASAAQALKELVAAGHLRPASELAHTTGPYVPDAETPEEKAQRLARRADNFRARWVANVPPMYATASLDDLDDNQHAVRLRAWLNSGSVHLVLAGAVGTGKTHAAYAVGHQALEAGLWVEAFSVGDLMDALRPGSTDRAAEQRARDARVLVLDDLPAKATDWEAERMTLLMDARIRAERQTIVTTNITAEQITATWGARFMDRLRYRLTPLTFVGESRRRADW